MVNISLLRFKKVGKTSQTSSFYHFFSRKETHFLLKLKVPKREIFWLAFFYTKWTHLGMRLKDWTKKWIFYYLTPDFEGFWFYAAYWVCGKQTKKIEARQELKVGCFGPKWVFELILESISGLLKSLKILSLIYSSLDSHRVRHHFTPWLYLYIAIAN